MILDGNSIVNRAFYGVRELSTRSGLHTNAVYGFLNILNRLQNEDRPDALCVAFDLPEPTFRHASYADYKAGRKPMPDELAEQLPWLKKVLSALRIPSYSCAGWEADDILGTAARICAESGWSCRIVTGDRDSLQLISETTTVRLVTTRQGLSTSSVYDSAAFQAEYGFAPSALVDFKALMGDDSDNIPGVQGIGKKTAAELLVRFGSLDGVYANLDDPALKKSVRSRLEAGKDSAYMSYTLAAIRTDVPIDFNPQNNVCQSPDRTALRELFRGMEFNRLMDRYALNEPDEPISREGPHSTQILQSIETGAQAAQQIARYRELPEPVACLPLPDLTAVVVTYTYMGESCADFYSRDTLGLPDYEEALRGIFGAGVRKLTTDSKTLIHMLLDRDLPAEDICWDVALAGYLLDPAAGDYSLQTLAGTYLHTRLASAEVYEETTLESSEARQAFAEACAAISGLYRILPDRLAQEGMQRLYDEIELPLCPVLAKMELRGVAADRNALQRFGDLLQKQAGELEQTIYLLAGESFNINSPKQLGTVLFEHLGLPAAKKTKTGWSTGADVLEKLRGRYPIADAVLRYRMLTKLKSTYADGLAGAIAADGRIHTTFQNMVTATGRLSSTEPNLQNIPVRTELGGEFRKMFVPRPGWVLVDADYSQIELRVLACVANDPAMQQAFLSGEDFHSHTASQVFHVPLGQVTPELRRRAKAVNFGIVYGISQFSLAQDLGVSVHEAADYIQSYLDRFAGVRDYMQQVVLQGREQGYVSTLFGRRRRIRDLTSSNHNLRSAAERMALNTPIQGTAADIIKLAMLRVDSGLTEAGLRGRLILQIHDELIVECPCEEAKQVAALLTDQMQKAAELAVPLKADAGWGESWAEAKK